MHQSSLISLSPPDRRLDRTLLEAPGGFLWWYVDLVDDNGNGLVLIWSFGLPFLPGYASRARQGRAQTPAERPSLNLSIYRGGELDFYLLQEYQPGEVSWSPTEDVWQFGETRIETSVEGGRLHLGADLDCAVQGSSERLVGRIELDGVCRKPGGEVDQASHHDWTPRLGPARGRCDIAHADHRWQLQGRAYHDRNGGSLPLHDIGIDYWLWGRVPQEDRELIYYLLWADGDARPVCKGLSIDADGTTELYDDLEVELRGERKNMGGLIWWETIALFRGDQLWLTVENTDVVDSGPFYMRYLTQAEGMRGPSARGIGELVKPDRIDLDRHRPLVRMRVHDLGGDNSMWLPLFTGPKTGRVRRLLGSWLGGGGR
jgi:hypothetical protein